MESQINMTNKKSTAGDNKIAKVSLPVTPFMHLPEVWKDQKVPKELTKQEEDIMLEQAIEDARDIKAEIDKSRNSVEFQEKHEEL